MTSKNAQHKKNSQEIIEFYRYEFIDKLVQELNKILSDNISVKTHFETKKYDNTIYINMNYQNTQILTIKRRIHKTTEKTVLHKEWVCIGHDPQNAIYVNTKNKELTKLLQGKSIASNLYVIENDWLKKNFPKININTESDNIKIYHLNMKSLDKVIIGVEPIMIQNSNSFMHQVNTHPTYNMPYNPLTGKLGMRLNDGRHVYATYTIEGRLA